MKTLLTIVLLFLSMFLFSQEVTYPVSLNIATYDDVLNNNKGFGTYDRYISKSGEIFNVGDTLTLGLPIRNNSFTYIMTMAFGADVAFVSIQAANDKVIIKKMEVWKNQMLVYTKNTGLNLRIYKFDEALKSGEITSKRLSSSEALKQLKEAKEKLDLMIITQEEYNTKKAELIKFIK